MIKPIVAAAVTVAALGITAAMSLQPVADTSERSGPVCSSAELKTTFGRWFSSGAVLASAQDPSIIQPGIPDFNVGGMRLFLKTIQSGDGNWKIVFRDSAQRLVALLDSSDFRNETGAFSSRGVWTGRIDLPIVSVQLIGGDTSVRVEIQNGIALPSKIKRDAQLFSIQTGTPAWQPLYDTKDARMGALGAVVGMMHTGGVSPDGADAGDFEPKSWCCSGVMLSNDLYFTNHHCGSAGGGDEDWTQEQCDATVIDLGWEDKGVRRQFSCTRVVAQDLRLDYAILRVGPVRGSEGARGGSLRVAVARNPAAVGEKVFIIHHAMCSPKLVSRKCSLLDRRRSWTDSASATELNEYGHDCDTEPGASGAPVFNGNGELVALHHLGFKQCDVGDKRNRAIGIQAIAADVRQKAPSIAAEIGW